MPQARAKFTVDEVTLHRYGGRTIRMYPVCADEIPENQRFNDATPSGELKMCVNNQEASKHFNPGDEFYVDFTKVEPVAEAAATDGTQIPAEE